MLCVSEFLDLLCYDLLSLPLGRCVLNYGWHKGGEKSLNGYLGGVIGSRRGGVTGSGKGDVIGGMIGLTGGGGGMAEVIGGIVADVVGSGG